MKIKTIKILAIFLIFGISFITHSAYDNFPNKLFTLFFPVNESIFEHMKMIFTSYIIYFILEYFLLKKSKEKYNNFNLSMFVQILFNIIFFLIIYIPIYDLFGYNTIITLLLYFFSIIITQIISLKILTNQKDYKILNKYSLLLIFIIWLILIYFTYFPIKNIVFIDYSKNKIGLKTYY
jgi:hypothetical protein